MLEFLKKINTALLGWRKLGVTAAALIAIALSDADPDVKAAVDGIVGSLYVIAQAYQNTNIGKK